MKKMWALLAFVAISLMAWLWSRPSSERQTQSLEEPVVGTPGSADPFSVVHSEVFQLPSRQQADYFREKLDACEQTKAEGLATLRALANARKALLISEFETGTDWHDLVVQGQDYSVDSEEVTTAWAEFQRQHFTLSTEKDYLHNFLELMGDPALGMSFLELVDTISAPDTFNAYVLLEGMTAFGSSAVSASLMLAVKAAELPPQAFSESIQDRKFTVNDLAAAIRVGIPPVYLDAFLQQVDEPHLMPVFSVESNFRRPLNLADVAAERLDLAALKVLAKHQIFPSQVVGWGSGLDNALRYDFQQLYGPPEVVERWRTRQIEVVEYLLENGQQAHRPDGATEDILMSYLQRLDAEPQEPENSRINPYLLPLVQKLQLIDEPGLASPSTSVISEALLDNLHQYKSNQSRLLQMTQQCSDLHAALNKTEKLLDDKARSALFQAAAERGGDEAQLAFLQEVDPSLAQQHMLTLAGEEEYASETGGSLTTLLNRQDSESALAYVLSTPLSQVETNALLYQVLTYPGYVELWRSRVQPRSPSGLFWFESTTLVRWRALADEGFDFSITDRWGQDLFGLAMFTMSEEVVNLLLVNTKPANPLYGMDALDYLLDYVYLQDRVPSYALSIVEAFDDWELSHKRRLVRLREFRPDRYSELKSQLQTLPQLTDEEPSVSLYSRHH